MPRLIAGWMHDLARATRTASRQAGTGRAATAVSSRLLDAYTDAHLGFVAIHPYADSNGRMARLLANVPVLRAGLPPLLVDVAARRDYLGLLGDYSLARGRPLPGEDLVMAGRERNSLRDFFAAQWRTTLDLVEAYRRRQAERAS